jgi:hypothetical protein
LVESSANEGESYYRTGGQWADLYDDQTIPYPGTANFTIKALTNDRGLRVSPAEDFSSEGPEGGPFVPAEKVYQLENRGIQPLDYAVTRFISDPWLAIVGPTPGTLPPGGTAEITVQLSGNADTLSTGLHSATVLFTNMTDHLGDTSRQADLAVGTPTLEYRWMLDADPSWSRDGDWAFGQPSGGGGEYGGPDPTSGHTGNYVYGYNLNGDYANNLPERHLTTHAFDCTGLFGVRLRFWRWLGVEQPAYDHAYVRVSSDAVNWTTVWSNQVEITDNTWVQQEVDISSVASQQPTVFVRWTMGPTDQGWRYCGWNIDDVEIWAVDEGSHELASDEGPGQPMGALRLGPITPNPSAGLTTVRYSLPSGTRVRLAMFDVRGRRVATVVDSHQQAGSHSVAWDGRSETGESLDSGLYFARLEAGREAQTLRLILAR